jgi:5-methylcytosine-specific restriction endonuclease McrA
MKNALGRVSAAEWSAIKKKQRNRCGMCDVKCKLTMDHIIPLARGGSNFAFNIQGLCGSCNYGKRAKLLTCEVSLFDRLDSVVAYARATKLPN